MKCQDLALQRIRNNMKFCKLRRRFQLRKAKEESDFSYMQGFCHGKIGSAMTEHRRLAELHKILRPKRKVGDSIG